MSDLTYDISGALNSQTYTPSVSDDTKKIYGLMSDDDISDDVYNQYKQIFDNLPTVNIYSAVIQNPNKGIICDAQDSINNILGSNATTTGQVQYNNSDTGSFGLQYYHVKMAGTAVPDKNGNTGINPNSTNTTDGDITTPDQNGIYPGEEGYQPSQNQINTMNNWDSTYPSTVSSLQNASNGVSDYKNHTDKFLANLPMILGIIQSALGLANILGELANPCLGLENFAGSITKKGTSLIQKIRDGIKKIEDLIGSALETIQKAIADVMAFVNKLQNLIETEIKNLIKAMIDGLKFGLSGLLSMLNSDPCMKSLLGVLGTGSLLSVL